MSILNELNEHIKDPKKSNNLFYEAEYRLKTRDYTIEDVQQGLKPINDKEKKFDEETQDLIKKNKDKGIADICKIILENALTNNFEKFDTALINSYVQDRWEKLTKKEKEKLFDNLHQEIRKNKDNTKSIIVDERFFKSDLIDEIHKELDKSHKLDNKEKLALFIVGCSAYLPDSSDHISANLRGDSSAGKDNAIKTALSQFPTEDYFLLTRATASAVEEEASKVKIIAFSEINKHRENGANNEITETFKQLSEGGVNILKKDANTGFKSTVNIRREQKTLFYGTTETESDDELETRYVIISIRGYANKNKLVVDSNLDNCASEEYYLDKDNKESWIARSIKGLDKELQTIIPYAPLFKEKIKDEDGKDKYLFDYTKERIKRDEKRLLSITRTITWLYQKQRVIKEIKGKKFVYSEPTDFLLALRIFSDFFNLTYTGLDHRHQKTLDCIKSNTGKHTTDIIKLGYGIDYSDWVLRNKIQEELNIESVNTIKSHIDTLKDLGRIDVHYDFNIPKGYLIRPINSPINKVSLPISLIAIDRSLTGWLIGKNYYKTLGKEHLEHIKTNFIDENLENEAKYVSGKLTGQKLTGQKRKDIHTIKWDIQAEAHHLCKVCKDTPTNEYSNGLFYCKKHFELLTAQYNKDKCEEEVKCMD